MEIVDFTRDYARAARRLAAENYAEERAAVPALPAAEIPDPSPFADYQLGAAAVEGGRLLGFLAFYPPTEDAFGSTGVRGTFSPIHAHGAVKDGRGRVYDRLYQVAAAKLAAAGIPSHAVALYAHDAAAIEIFFQNGFGQRCADAIRPMTAIAAGRPAGAAFREVAPGSRAELLELHNLLIAHLGGSPCFMRYPPFIAEQLAPGRQGKDVRYFAAYCGGVPAAYLKLQDDGENFACGEPSMVSICGACCLPEYRGTGLARALLSFMIDALAAEGVRLLGVDFESFNPTVRGFWLKHFTAYTCSVVRRIDDRAVSRR